MSLVTNLWAVNLTFIRRSSNSCNAMKGLVKDQKSLLEIKSYVSARLVPNHVELVDNDGAEQVEAVVLEQPT